MERLTFEYVTAIVEGAVAKCNPQHGLLEAAETIKAEVIKQLGVEPNITYVYEPLEYFVHLGRYNVSLTCDGVGINAKITEVICG